MSTFERLESMVLSSMLPAYESLGGLTGLYFQGSLARGYTDTSDLDAVLVWQAYPHSRRSVLGQLTENGVVDFAKHINDRDLHLDLLRQGSQEYNLAHLSLASLHRQVEMVMAGKIFTYTGLGNPLVASSGFFYGQIAIDRDGALGGLREKLSDFPEALRASSKARLAALKNMYVKELRTRAKRNDGFALNMVLVEATELFLVTWFADNGVYYPGEKWLQKNIQSFKLKPQEVARNLEELFTASCDNDRKVSIIEALMGMYV